MTRKLNILILHADQYRWDCLGCAGNPDVKTPHIDSIAAEGVRHSNHFTVYPVCTPSRYSLLSGLYTHQHLAWSNRSTLPEGIPTFPRLLRERGWNTAAVGKMHMTPSYQDVGYERMLLAEQNGVGRYEDDYHAYLSELGLLDLADLTDQADALRAHAPQAYYDCFGAAESDLPAEHHSTSWITRQAKREIDRWRPDGGNLLFVGYVKPHHPFDPPAPYSKMYDPDKLTLLPGFTPEGVVPRDAARGGFFDYAALNEVSLRRVMAQYYGVISHIDDNIGELLALLRERGVYDDTLLVFTSDHGEYLGYHHMLLKGNYLYDPLARIPLLLKYPAGMGQTGMDSRLSENIDLTAELLAVCGIPAPAQTRGRPLTAPGPGREFVFSEGQYGTDEQPRLGYMARSRRYKLLVEGSLENALFFDLESDPCELLDRSGDPALAAELARHREFLIQTLLFRSVSGAYCHTGAAQLQTEETLAQRAAEVKALIRRQTGFGLE